MIAPSTASISTSSVQGKTSTHHSSNASSTMNKTKQIGYAILVVGIVLVGMGLAGYLAPLGISHFLSKIALEVGIGTGGLTMLVASRVLTRQPPPSIRKTHTPHSVKTPMSTTPTYASMGIKNPGKTPGFKGTDCFMNSVFQIFTSVPELYNSVVNRPLPSQEALEVLARAPGENLQDLQTASHFLQAFRSVLISITRYREAPSQELLNEIMRGKTNLRSYFPLDDTIVRNGGMGDALDVQTKLCSSLRSLYPNEKSPFDPVNHSVFVHYSAVNHGNRRDLILGETGEISIGIESSDLSIQEGLNLALTSQMPSDYRWTDPDTGTVIPNASVTKQIQYTCPPSMLRLEIRRYERDNYGNQTIVVRNPKITSEIRLENSVYELVGGVHHSLLGTKITGGHYTSYVRQQDNTWLYCNDEKVLSVAEATVLRALKTNGTQLYYRKKEAAQAE